MARTTGGRNAIIALRKRADRPVVDVSSLTGPTHRLRTALPTVVAVMNRRASVALPSWSNTNAPLLELKVDAVCAPFWKRSTTVPWPSQRTVHCCGFDRQLKTVSHCTPAGSCVGIPVRASGNVSRS